MKAHKFVAVHGIEKAKAVLEGAPVMYILMFFVGLLTLNNPHRFAVDALNEMS